MWYSARILYKSIHKNKRKITRAKNMYEEVVILFSSENNRNELSKKAKGIAKQKEISYQNYKKETVKWKFIKLLKIQEIEESLEDGIEVAYRHFTNISAYKRFEPLLTKH